MKKALSIIICVTLCGIIMCSCQSQGGNNNVQTENPSVNRTENIYAMSVKYTAENENDQTYLAIAERSRALFSLLEEHAAAFVMDAYNYQAIDGDGTPLYTQNSLSLPIEIDAGGYSIRISKNYFKFNPIETVSGRSLEEQIVLDDATLNILVPEQHRQHENDIIEEYRANFYFEKIEVANVYNENLGLPLDETALEDLKINIIYVKDGQEYFTYRNDLAVETQSIIIDPIVSVYTENIHVSYAHSFMTQFVYFHSEEATEEEAYQSILPYIQQCEAEASFQKVLSVKSLFTN